MKVMTVVGTRPEIIKLSRVIAALERHTEHVLVHSGQNYDHQLNEVFFKEMRIKAPDHFLEAVGGSVAETIGLIIARADAVMAEVRPDAVLFYGDTNTCLAAISAKRRQIPVFHMEAGNRCFDQRVPEEINRKILDHISDINMPLTEHARRYLLAEGLRPETVIKTGSTMKEVLGYYRSDIEASDVLARLGLERGGYFVVSAHREENVDSPGNLADLIDTLGALAEAYDKPVLVSVHPRTRNRLDALEGGAGPTTDPRVRFSRPFGFFDYIKLQTNALCVLSDSGTLTEESSLLGFPAVMIRQAHERPEGMDEGVLIMSGLKRHRVLEAVGALVSEAASPGPGARRVVPDYQADDVSGKVVRIILSYTDYVNRTVWRKPS